MYIKKGFLALKFDELVDRKSRQVIDGSGDNR